MSAGRVGSIGLVLPLVLGGCRAAELIQPRWEGTVVAEEALKGALERAEAAGAAVRDLTCLFHRHERVGSHLGSNQRIEVKFRRQPYSLYMRWVAPPGKAGSELLYVAGRYQGKVFARQRGLFGILLPTVRLAPDDPLILAHSRYALTDFGLDTPARRALRLIQRVGSADDLRVRFLGEGEVYGEPALGYEALLPEMEDLKPRQLLIWFDPVTGLIKRTTTYDPRGRLLEDYAFTRMRINVGLTDADFDPTNPAYRFVRQGR